MATARQLNTLPDVTIKHPINIGSRYYAANKLAHYHYLLEEAPVYKGKVSVINAYFVSRYEDCVMVLKDPRFVRNRTTATGGGSQFPFPLPRSLKALANSMIIEDDPEHRRTRNLVHKAFTPRALRKLEERIEGLTHELLDQAEPQGRVDLQAAYALPIPVTVISEMMGLRNEETGRFKDAFTVLSEGFSGLSILRTVFFDVPSLGKFVRELVERKRHNPGDDILTGLIQAEEDGDKLSEDELVSLVFLLVVAGYETTVHLITNAVLTLLTHPDQLQLLRENPDLMPSTVEECLRFAGPVRSSKPVYAKDEITLHGVTIPNGAPIFPLTGAANRDPRQFENPDTFDITREHNRHLGFGQGIHYCLGAPLARMETQIALRNLLARNPNLRLDVDPTTLKPVAYPGWHRYNSLPVVLG